MAEKKSESATATATKEENQRRQENQGRQGTQQRGQTQQGRQQGQERQGQGEGQQSGAMARRSGLPAGLFMNPFALLGRLAEEMTGVFAEAAPQGQAGSGQLAGTVWAPDIDVFQRGNELVIRADLPGVNLDDLVVEISDDAVTLSGERMEERREDQDGVYRVERSYGAFYRVIPLPEGAIVDQANATFRDGVLEITIPAPPEQVSRGRRLQVTQGEQQREQRAENRESSNDRNSPAS
jgi:HSP20 family protein